MKSRKRLVLGVVLLLVNCCLPLVTAAEAKWAGVDDSVVAKFAREHGREKRTSYINTDQGDLLLFVFLLAGIIGGFTAGYSWCLLVNRKSVDVLIGKVPPVEHAPLQENPPAPPS